MELNLQISWPLNRKIILDYPWPRRESDRETLQKRWSRKGGQWDVKHKRIWCIFAVLRWRGLSPRECRQSLETEKDPQAKASKETGHQFYSCLELNYVNSLCKPGSIFSPRASRKEHSPVDPWFQSWETKLNPSWAHWTPRNVR